MDDTSGYLHNLLISQPLVEPLIDSAICTLNLPLASIGLDAGCGIGMQATRLAKAVGPSGYVIGLDISPEFLSFGKYLKKINGLPEHISFVTGDVRGLPFANHSFDWAWSSDCVGYGPWDPVPLLKELARVVKPGGIVAILAWSSQVLLPGHPLLEAHLNATAAGISPFDKGRNPEMHFMFGLRWFREAGLEKPIAKTFVHEVFSPLTDELRQAMINLFKMRWSGAEIELAPEDRAEYLRFCRSESADFLPDHPDYYAFFTYSMFQGKVP